jgi:hypothetical protein
VIRPFPAYVSDQHLRTYTIRRRLSGGIVILRIRMKLLPTTGFMTMVLLAACGPAGSGNIVSQERETGQFESIEVSGGIDLTLTVDAAADGSVTVIYDENLLDRIVTEVDGTTLVIRSGGNFNVFGSGRRVEVTTATLEELSVSGGSDVDATGSLDRLVVSASGGSDLDLSDLVVDSMVMAASGGSDVAVNVTGEIVGNASGGSNLTIRGQPARQDIEVSGGADVSND